MCRGGNNNNNNKNNNNSSMCRVRIAVIGGGFYGCHMASVLAEQTARAPPCCLDITLFERESHLFAGSSSKHQFRLHLGYHYPRSHKTRVQTIRGFQRFKRRYPSFSKSFAHNVYAVADAASIVDFGTYRQIMNQQALDAERDSSGALSPPQHRHVTAAQLRQQYGYKRCAGGLVCQEEFLFVQTPRRFFEQRLADLGVCVRLDTSVTDICVNTNANNTNANVCRCTTTMTTTQHQQQEDFDWVLNCTYQASFPSVHLTLYYEVCVTLVYHDTRPGTVEHGNVQALTIMDGPFVSLYPYVQDEAEWTRRPYRRLYTLTSVTHTPYRRFTNAADATRCLRDMQQQQQQGSSPPSFLPELRQKFEQEIVEFYPAFARDFAYVDYFVSMKTKMDDASASRECLVEREHERLIHVLAGKISTLFVAEDLVRDILRDDVFTQ